MSKSEIIEDKDLIEILDNVLDTELIIISGGVKSFGLYKGKKTSSIYELSKEEGRRLQPETFIIEGEHKQVKDVMTIITTLNR